jgi:hypothetical protein
MSHKLNSAIAVIGIDIGKNSFHIVGHEWDRSLPGPGAEDWSALHLTTKLKRGFEAITSSIGAISCRSMRVALITESAAATCGIPRIETQRGSSSTCGGS